MDILPQTKEGIVLAISVSDEKGTKKRNVERAEVKQNFGIIGDAHAGADERQISLLSRESINKAKAKGLDVRPGDFAENITSEGIDWSEIKIGDKLQIGEKALLEISQIGKECHEKCPIEIQTGMCIMPQEGIFARVLKGGIIKAGDKISKVTKSY